MRNKLKQTLIQGSRQLVSFDLYTPREFFLSCEIPRPHDCQKIQTRKLDPISILPNPLKLRRFRWRVKNLTGFQPGQRFRRKIVTLEL